MAISLVTTDPVYVQTNCGGQTTPGGPPPNPTISDAILKPRIIFTNGFDTPGQIYRFGWVDNVINVHDANIKGNEFTAGFPTARGQFTWHETGGRDNGGYLSCSVNTNSESTDAGIHQGNYISYVNPGSTFNTRSNTVLGAFRFNSPPPYKIHILGLGQHDQGTFGVGGESGAPYFVPHFAFYVNPNMSCGVRSGHPFDANGLNNHDSATILPLSQWFLIELQGHNQTPQNNVAGFTLAQLYTLTGPVEGISLVRAISIPVHAANMNAFAIGSEVAANSNGFAGLDIDDHTLCDNSGLVKKFMGNIYIGPTKIAGPGDETNSIISFTSVPHVISDTTPINIEAGITVNHGDSNRYLNVDGLNNVRPFNELLNNSLFFDSGIDTDPSPFVSADLSYGGFSASTGVWQEGPFVPPQARYINFAAPPVFNVVTMENAIIRNTFHDTLKDLYTINIDRSGIALIEGIQPTFRTGARSLIGGVLQHGVSAAYTDLFSAIDDKAALRPTDYDQHSNPLQLSWRKHAKFLLKDVNGLWASAVFNTMSGIIHTVGVSDIAQSQNWVSRQSYDLAPYSFLINHPITGVPFTQLSDSSLRNFQVGIQGDFTAYDADTTPLPQDAAHRWIRFDCCELGFDFVYHKDIPNVIEHAPFPPIAFLFLNDFNNVTRVLHVNDSSDDWDGTVVSAVVNWGDGTAAQAITPNGGLVAHTYAAPGVYTIIETVTDNDGLTSTFTITPINAFVPAAPNFTDTNPAGNQINFTDTSNPHDETINAWHWDFGDGNTSTSQNPSHTYAAPGTYAVSLTITTNFSGNLTAGPTNVTVPFVISGCNPSADFMAVSANTMGDDFHGDNVFPNYANLAAFDAIYTHGGPSGGAGSYWYKDHFDPVNDGVSHLLDTGKLFNSHQTYNMKYGKPASTTYKGGGWFSMWASGNGSGASKITVSKGWIRLRFQYDAGVVSDNTLINGDTNSGLEIFSWFPGNGAINEGIFIRNNNVILDDNNGGNNIICTETTLGANAGWVDVLLLYDGSNQHAVRRAVWIAPACNLSGKSPVFDTTIDYGATANISKFNSTDGFAGFEFLFCGFTPSGALKNLWVPDAEAMPYSVDANPFSVVGN